VSRSIVKYAALFAAMVIAGFACSCGGGGGTITSNPAPTPTSGPYSATSLSGTYAFEMSGVDTSEDSFLARVGSFTANGAGGVTGGVQDLSSALTSASVTLAIASGTYSIGPNGKGTLSLVDSAETAQFSIVMTSATAGLITETDGIATASGNFTLQDTTTFAAFPTNFSGPYVFDFSGLDPNGAAESIVGQFTGNGAGGFTSGVADVNDDFTASGQLPVTGTFTRDATYGSTFGRGTATFAVNGSTLNFAFYTVGAGRIRMLRTDFPAASIGDAIAQTGTIATATSGLTGSFAFIMGGSNLIGADVRAGRVTLSSGAVSNVELDDDNSSASGSGNSNHAAIPEGTISAASYTIDPSGDGRGTLTFNDSSAGTFSFIFYLSSPTQAVIQDVSTGSTTLPIVVSDGSMQMQTGNPFTTAGEAGNWAFNWSGESVNGNTGSFGEEDFVGQYTQTSSGSISGGVDFTELSASSVVTNGAFTGTMTIAGDGTLRNTYSVTLATSPAATLNFAAYVVDANTIFVVGVDTHRTITGSILRNF
jgi:hypothetical protein